MPRLVVVLALCCGMMAVGCETSRPGYVAHRSVAEAEEAQMQDGKYLRDLQTAPAPKEEDEHAQRTRHIIYGVLIGVGVVALALAVASAMAMAAVLRAS